MSLRPRRVMRYLFNVTTPAGRCTEQRRLSLTAAQGLRDRGYRVEYALDESGQPA